MVGYREIIVGIDFGTTSSGVGFYIPQNRNLYNIPDNGLHILKYGFNGDDGLPAAKAPTILAYAEENEDLSETAWGFGARAYPSLVSWFKLFLEENIDVDNWCMRAKDWANSRGIMRLPDGGTPIKPISDFLTFLYGALWGALVSKARQEIGNIDDLSVKFCFTVPVLWSLQARHDMKVAISRAGFNSRNQDKVCLLTEAEAAMTFALSQSRIGDENSLLKTGDGVVICDCGGGATDIASYKVSNHDLFIYDELVQSGGKLCGSTSIDRDFYRLMQRRFGDSFSSLPAYDISQTSKFMYEFEKAKCTFTGNESFALPLAMTVSSSQLSKPRWYINGDVQLSKADLETLFRPALQMIIESLRRHIERVNSAAGRTMVINKIILVGGFSLSPYFYRVLRDTFPNISIIRRDEDVLTAVIRGATLWGMGAFRPQSMLSPYSYGLQALLPVNSSLDDSRIHLNGPTSNLAFFNGPINWIIRKGERYNRGVSLQYGCAISHVKGTFNIKMIPVYMSDKVDRPQSVDAVGGPDLRIAGYLEFNLAHVDFRRCRYFEQNRQGIWVVEYTLLVEMGEADGNFRLTAVCQGGNQLAQWEVRPSLIV
ncbi:actin-like ATPase domain-containing protein [Penicillium angulare]|uniref:Actin-like ATPase domain-containing protein n=1 Tax=Penicillium angulare TaxID=116970 RepID=A0A9W9JZS9_9EURO|nr:actin-like ATPase domain-containing protein [Penicillium angulare]